MRNQVPSVDAKMTTGEKGSYAIVITCYIPMSLEEKDTLLQI